MSENKGSIKKKTFGIGMRMGRKKGPGAPPPKKRRKKWFIGPPLYGPVMKNGKATMLHSRYGYGKKGKAAQCSDASVA